MSVYRPLRAALFFYEILRLLALAGLFMVFSPLEGAAKGGVFPYLVYITPNALFPLMTLFMWLRPWDYRNYLPLYMAGKVIAATAFYGWGFFVLRTLGPENLMTANLMETLVFFGGSFVLNLFDIFSVFGSWILVRKTNGMEESAGLSTGGNGGL
ncbi:MAG: hypothetical protein LBJ24_00165 [Treponema sp.]|jgi:hypothetical protein|nr:hypothetical protein [Treponema sp.]